MSGARPTADAATALVPAAPAALLSFDQRIVAGTVSAGSLAKYAEHFRAHGTFAATPDAARAPTPLARWRTALVTQDAPHLAPDTINLKLAAICNIMTAAEQGMWQARWPMPFGACAGATSKH